MMRTRWNAAALALGCMGIWAAAAGDALARQASGAPPAAPPTTQAAPPPRHHHHHHHHVRHRVAAARVHGLGGEPAAAVLRPNPGASADGYVPAPVVPQPPAAPDAEANIVPPKEPVPQQQQVSPQTMQLHYPFAGNGYVTGSSPQAMDDATTAKIPGVIVQMPIQPTAPQKLPPP
jgi:hypothetical protein